MIAALLNLIPYLGPAAAIIILGGAALAILLAVWFAFWFWRAASRVVPSTRRSVPRGTTRNASASLNCPA
jgi:hypothetical protein